MLSLYEDIHMSESQGVLVSLPSTTPLISGWGLYILINWAQSFVLLALILYNG